MRFVQALEICALRASALHHSASLLLLLPLPTAGAASLLPPSSAPFAAASALLPSLLSPLAVPSLLLELSPPLGGCGGASALAALSLAAFTARAACSKWRQHKVRSNRL